MGYDFTGGRIFDFPIDFSMALQQCSGNMLPVIILSFSCLHQARLAGGSIMFSTCLFVYTSARNQTCQQEILKQTDQFVCKLPQVVYRARARNDQLLGSKVKVTVPK